MACLWWFPNFLKSSVVACLNVRKEYLTYVKNKLIFKFKIKQFYLETANEN